MQQSELELDSLNLLYVALTRPIEQLHIISKMDVDKNGHGNPKKYSGLLINYLKENDLWQDSQLEYSFGNNKKLQPANYCNNTEVKEQQFLSSNIKDLNIKIVTKSALLWDTKQKEAIEKGNLIHTILSEIYTINDVDFVIDDFIKSSIINHEQASELKHTIQAIVNHQKLSNYYDSNYTIFNEREIIASDGTIHIPDRIVINSKNEAVIIDYKTGLENDKYLNREFREHSPIEILFHLDAANAKFGTLSKELPFCAPGNELK